MSVIGVFCASRLPADPRHAEAARQLGQWIGRSGHTLMYGGSRLGLMDITARAVHESGGRVYGAIPDVLVDRGLVGECVDVEFRCAGLSDRKEIFLRECDLFVALPGGVGTLDEIFTVVAAATIGEHTRRTVLLDVAGFWRPLLAMLDAMRREGLVDEGLANRLVSVGSVDELAKLCP